MIVTDYINIIIILFSDYIIILFSSIQQLREIAEKEDLLVPIRLEIDGADGYKLRDTFTWNINGIF